MGSESGWVRLANVVNVGITVGTRLSMRTQMSYAQTSAGASSIQ